MKFNILLHTISALICTAISIINLNAEEMLNVYSSRHYGGDKELFDAFTAKTGIKVNLVEAKSGALIARVIQEGKGCPADLLILTDAGNLGQAAAKDLFHPIERGQLAAGYPKEFIDADAQWIGLGRRHRVIVYSPERVEKNQLPNYMDLAKPEWKNRIVIRSSSNIYNQSLLASIIAHYNVDQAEAWAAGVRKNMAREPQGNDRAQIKAVAAGEADIAVVNHYYYLKMLNSDDPAQVEAAKKVAVHFPDQGKGQFGAHTNITGIGILKNGPNPLGAQVLVSWLSSQEGQALFIKPSNEFSVRDDVKMEPNIFPNFRHDTLPVSKLAEFNAEAVKIFDRVDWR